MVVTTFSRTEAAGVTLGERHAVGITRDGRWLLVDTTCPHRGGPLHLGQFDADASTVTCPWHGRVAHCNSLQPLGEPWIRSGDQISMLIKRGIAVRPIVFSTLTGS